KPLPMEKLQASELVIKGERYHFQLDKVHWEFTYRVDPTMKPATIDLTVVQGPEKGKTFRGIYAVEGDSYKICRPVKPDQARPTEFGTKADSGLMLTVWKRQKP